MWLFKLIVSSSFFLWTDSSFVPTKQDDVASDVPQINVEEMLQELSLNDVSTFQTD